jgi:hypothetical protein
MLDVLVFGTGRPGRPFVGYSPHAETTNLRTRELLRRWGIADPLPQALPIPMSDPAGTDGSARVVVLHGYQAR